MTEFYVSISDIGNFLKCRQMWDFASANRQSLRHKKTPALYLTEGTALHLAIETAINYELGLSETKPFPALEDYLNQERQDRIDAYTAENNMAPWETELQDFDQSAAFVTKLTEQYFQHYGQTDMLEDQDLTYLASEVSFKIPLPTLAGVGVLVYFVGTFDALAVDRYENIWVVEHKTYGSKPDSEDLMFHFQSNGYALAFEWLTGIKLTGLLYDGVAKRLIQPPKILGNGKVSVDQRQSVTLQTYLDGLAAAGEDPWDDRYTDILQMLQDREDQGDSRFFHREKVFFNEHQVSNWRDELLAIVREMVSDPAIYRTVPYNGCGPRGQGCWFRDLCQTKHSGGDVQFVLDTRYMTGTYGTVDAVRQAEPSMVNSPDELKAFLRGEI